MRSRVTLSEAKSLLRTTDQPSPEGIASAAPRKDSVAAGGSRLPRYRGLGGALCRDRDSHKGRSY
jgi:hypothetical protein